MITVLIILGVGAGLAVGGYLFLRSRAEPEELYYRFLCPSCGRKLRYRARKAGRPGMCPRCKQRCTFPAVPKA